MSSVSTSNIYNRHNIGSLLDNLELNAPIHERTATELDRLLKNIASEKQIKGVIRDINNFGDTEDEYSRRSGHEEEGSTEDDVTEDEEVVEPTSVDSRDIGDYGDSEDEYYVYSGDEGSTGHETEDEVFEEVVYPEIGDAEDWQNAVARYISNHVDMWDQYGVYSGEDKEDSTGDETSVYRSDIGDYGDSTDKYYVYSGDEGSTGHETEDEVFEEVVYPEIGDAEDWQNAVACYISNHGDTARDWYGVHSGDEEASTGDETEDEEGHDEPEVVDGLSLAEMQVARFLTQLFNNLHSDSRVETEHEQHAAAEVSTSMEDQEEEIRQDEAKRDGAIPDVASVAENLVPLVQNQANVNLKRARDMKEEVEEADADAGINPQADKENRRPMKRGKRA